MEGRSRIDRSTIGGVLVCLLVVSAGSVAQSGVAGTATVGPAVSESRVATNPCVGAVAQPANGATVISVQGYNESGKQPAMLVGVGPRGEVLWVHHNAEAFDAVWSYDVDPMANGNLFVTAAVRGGKTAVYEFDPETQETVWTERFDLADTHDADLIDGGEAIVVANLRNYNETAGENDARIFVYDRTREEIVWEWKFREQTEFEESRGANYTKAWTHVNDVDEVEPGRYLVSPRNFDQVMVVNRSSKEIEMRLGEDAEYEVLNRQHNPDHLESENGTPTILVADSGNDRVVEYARDGDRDEWKRTWTLGSGETLDWPRDADRLANGNTLITDTKNQRVIEVTPEGEIVWEFYAPWLPYDAARLTHVGESEGPTIGDLGQAGTYEPANSSGLHHDERDLAECHSALRSIDGLTDEGREGEDEYRNDTRYSR